MEPNANCPGGPKRSDRAPRPVLMASTRPARTGPDARPPRGGFCRVGHGRIIQRPARPRRLPAEGCRKGYKDFCDPAHRSKIRTPRARFEHDVGRARTMDQTHRPRANIVSAGCAREGDARVRTKPRCGPELRSGGAVPRHNQRGIGGSFAMASTSTRYLEVAQFTDEHEVGGLLLRSHRHEILGGHPLDHRPGIRDPICCS